MHNEHTDPIARGLADRLAGESARLDVGTPMVDVVVRRGRQRQQRKRTATSVLVVAGVCAAAIVSVNVLTRPTEHRVVTGDSPTSGTVPSDGAAGAVTPVAAQLVESNLTWSRFDPDSAAAVVFLEGAQQLTGPAPYLAWSTSPGKEDLRSMLWRSDDGLSWHQAPSAPTGRMADLAVRDGRHISYGTAPAASGTGSQSVLATSDDAGATWATRTLPIDVSAYEGQRGVGSVTISSVDVAAGPQGVLAIARVSAQLDQSVLPEGIGGDWILSRDGIEIRPYTDCSATDTATTAPACVATTVVDNGAVAPTSSAGTTAAAAGTRYSWADLGIAPEVGRLLAGTERHLLFSADGTDFVEVADPTNRAERFWDARVINAAGSFVVVITENSDAGSTTRLFRSPDGSAWTDLGLAPFNWSDTLGAMGERIVMSGWLPDPDRPQGPARSVVGVREPDGTWRTVNLDGLVLPSDGVKATMSLGSLAIGPHGITGVGYLYVDPIAEVGGIEVERNGITMRADDGSGNLTFADPAGTELGRIESWQTTSPLVEIDEFDGSSFHVRREDGGEIVATFSQQDIFEQVPSTDGLPQTFVLHSTDGVSWSREPLDDLVGEPVRGSGGVRVTDTQVIVAANLAGETNANGTARQTLLMGTPTI